MSPSIAAIRSALLGLLAPALCIAAEVDLDTVAFSCGNRESIRFVHDDDLQTRWSSPGPQAPGTSITIDLGRPMAFYGLYLNAGKDANGSPRSIRVSVGDEAERLVPVADQIGVNDAGIRQKSDFWRADTGSLWIRVRPRVCRFVNIAIGEQGGGFPWTIAEMEIHAADAGSVGRIAIVADRRFIDEAPGGKPAAFHPIRRAAEELQYYLMEMTGRRVDIVDGVTDSTASTVIRLVSPSSDDGAAFTAPEEDLDAVDVVADGAGIAIRGATSRAVLYGALELLSSQGVRWAYPDAHADVVPRIAALDLGVLPIRYRPPFTTRGFLDPGNLDATAERFSAFMLHHGCNFGFPDRGVRVGTVPRLNCGFGWAHTMATILGGGFQGKSDTEKLHPDWWPGPYRSGWTRVPCTSNGQLQDFIAGAIDQAIAARAKSKAAPYQGFSIHPTDSPAYCECDRCKAAFGTPKKLAADGADEACDSWNYSNHHFSLIARMAERMKKEHPGLFIKTLAYTNHEMPPDDSIAIPDNVAIDLCPWWSAAPIGSAANARYRDLVARWAGRCRSVGIWSYVLIYSDTTFGLPAGEKNVLVANARTIADVNRLYAKVGVKSVATQLYGPQSHWPWALYAFACTLWHPDEDHERMMADFFAGYYHESADDMRRWYMFIEGKALERGLDTNVLNAAWLDEQEYAHAQDLLRQARERAKHWYVKERVEQAMYDLAWSMKRAQWRTRSDRTYACARVRTPLAIDGADDDPAWRALPSAEGFRIVATRANDAVPGRYAFINPTSFKMGWDDSCLFIEVRCADRDMAGIQSRDAADTEFRYRDAVEMFFAPEAPPYYRQLIISSAGFTWGPVKITHVNAHEPVPDAGYAAHTSYSGDHWTIRTRIPFAMLASRRPKVGDLWPMNLIRASRSGQAVGEQYTSWTDMPKYSFHDYQLGTWGILEFADGSASEAAAADSAGVARFQAERARYLEAAASQPAGTVVARVAAGGMAAVTDASRTLDLGYIVTLDDEVAFDELRIRWANRRIARRSYAVEYWDGSGYRPLYACDDNRDDLNRITVAPTRTRRLRLLINGDFNLWNDVKPVQSIELVANGPSR